MIVHDVFFALTDNSPAACQKLVDSCKKHLTNHPGGLFFSAGVLVKEYDRPVNDRDWDVGLHVVFKDRASHDLYQSAPRHLDFIAESKPNWKKVRVFDTESEG